MTWNKAATQSRSRQPSEFVLHQRDQAFDLARVEPPQERDQFHAVLFVSTEVAAGCVVEVFASDLWGEVRQQQGQQRPVQIGQLGGQAIELALDGRSVGCVVGASGVEQQAGGGFDAGVPQFGVIGVRLLEPSAGAAVERQDDSRHHRRPCQYLGLRR